MAENYNIADLTRWMRVYIFHPEVEIAAMSSYLHEQRVYVNSMRMKLAALARRSMRHELCSRKHSS